MTLINKVRYSIMITKTPSPENLTLWRPWLHEGLQHPKGCHQCHSNTLALWADDEDALMAILCAYLPVYRDVLIAHITDIDDDDSVLNQENVIAFGNHLGAWLLEHKGLQPTIDDIIQLAHAAACEVCQPATPRRLTPSH
jgi:hypothetical protein